MACVILKNWVALKCIILTVSKSACWVYPIYLPWRQSLLSPITEPHQLETENITWPGLLEESCEETLRIIIPFHWFIRLQAHHALSAPFLWNSLPRDNELALTHTGIKVNILAAHKEWPVRRVFEPGVDFPENIERNDEWESKVSFEEGFSVGTTTNRLKER